MTPNLYNVFIIVIISRFVVSRCKVMPLRKRTSHQKAVEIESVNKMGQDASTERVTSIDALAVCRAHRVLPVGFLLLRYSV